MRSVIAIVSALVLSVTMAGPAAAAPSPYHIITCKWVDMGAPFHNGATAVGANVRVQCSDRLDDANTQSQLQVSINGQMQDYGNPVTSYSTATVITVYDGAAGKSGCYYYRVKGSHFGQHGNIFALPTFYSGASRLCF